MALAAAIGALLGLGVYLFGRWVAFDRDRSFYPTVLIVIASYYVLFAVLAGSAQGIAIELAFAAVFATVALASLSWGAWLAALGIFTHGLFDALRGQFGLDDGAPMWWPAFCGAVDVVLGLLLLARVRRNNGSPS
ncbi:hypothetical protein [Novosphingobium sp.]|uniref:hypothetical protein n=1 Tax=Novosphingobium sp. TaxID=1874826 RepID=UPI00262AA8F5|nr:hypothetical protein [Novosphingobium sp.]